MHGLYVIEETNNPNSDTTSKRAYQLQKKEKAFAAVEGFKAKPLAPSQIQQMLKDTIADSFAAVKRLDAKENAGSGIIKQNRRYNTNAGSSSWGGALKGGAVPSGDIIEYSLGESQVLNSMQEELDKAQKRKKKQLGIITLKRVDRADVFSTTIDWNSATAVNS